MQGGVSPRCGGIAIPGAGCAHGPPSLRSVRFPLRLFLVHPSGDLMFGSLRDAVPARDAPLP
eukprot:6213647-Pleurochrysis_carterae.AAC.3